MNTNLGFIISQFPEEQLVPQTSQTQCCESRLNHFKPLLLMMAQPSELKQDDGLCMFEISCNNWINWNQ